MNVKITADWPGALATIVLVLVTGAVIALGLLILGGKLGVF
jgi:hypothetical protein